MIKQLLNYLTIEYSLHVLFNKICNNFPIPNQKIKCDTIIKYISYKDNDLQYTLEFYESYVMSTTDNELVIKPLVTIRTTNHLPENLANGVWSIEYKYINEILR